MKIELLHTGTELLLGAVLNTHGRFLAQALFPLGLRIARQTTVPDGEPIRAALGEIFPRAELLLITGGLGPTTDDVTREIVAEKLGLGLIEDPEIWRQIEERFAQRGLPMSPRNRRQAMRPAEATVLWNPHGTAPGLYLPAMPERGSPHLFLLPGPPRELHPMVADFVLPILEKIRPGGERDAMRVFRIAGLGESLVEEMAGEALLALGIELGYCARPGEVDIRVIGPEEKVQAGAEIIERKFQSHLVSQDERSLEKVVVDLLAGLGRTLALAESCTGGAIAHRVTNVPGASAVLLAGFVAYANPAKTRSLGVPPDLIARHGAVSEPVALAMAEGARAAADADYAIATTGIAGPGGGTAEKPVGTVFIGLAGRNAPGEVHALFFPTDRERFKELASHTALDLLRRRLLAAGGAPEPPEPF
jgi:nicotinamide-nucleotide amidase